jgi:hypothetical protein
VLARFTIRSDYWDAEVQRWTRHQPGLARLLELETRLQGLDGLIGARWGINYGLDAAYHATADNITAYLEKLKNALWNLEPVLVQAGDEVTYDPATSVLSIPYTLARRQAVDLGEEIVSFVPGHRPGVPAGTHHFGAPPPVGRVSAELWRRVWDSNPRGLSPALGAFKAPALVHYANPPGESTIAFVRHRRLPEHVRAGPPAGTLTGG